MLQKTGYQKIWQNSLYGEQKAGMIISYCLSAITIITFAFAMFAIPISGANAPNAGIPYPYLNTLQQYPRDFIWQYLAIGLMIVYLVQYAIFHSVINEKEKLPVKIGFMFAIISTIILICDYYIQVTVVPVSLLSNETEGLPLLIQYNPHGVFIALEEIGYIMMLLSFFCYIPVFWDKKYESRKISIINLAGFVIVVVSYVAICLKYGLDKKDRFETLIISICWLLMIINGFLIGNRMRRKTV